MKNAGLVIAMVCLVVTAESRAVFIAEETFSYVDGDLYGANGGTGWTTIWNATAMTSTGGRAIGANTITDPKYGSRNFDNPQTTPELFVAFDLIVPVSFALNDYAGTYLSAGVNNANIFVGKIPGSNEFHVGIGGFISSGIVIEPGVTYRLVGVYDIDQRRLAMWVDPDASDYYVPTTGASSADATTSAVIVFHMDRVDFLTNTAVGFAFDNFLLGNTPEDVGLLSAAPTDCDCPGDVNGDTFRDGLDVQDFVDCLRFGGSCDCADMDGVGGVDMADVMLFVDEIIGGTACP